MGTRGYIINPPRCTICGFTIGRDDLFLFDDGSPACFNCSYRCSVCKVRTTYLTIVVGMQAFCETCFKCGDCKGKIRLRGNIASTSDGFYWLKCTGSLYDYGWTNGNVVKTRELKQDLPDRPTEIRHRADKQLSNPIRGPGVAFALAHNFTVGAF